MATAAGMMFALIPWHMAIALAIYFIVVSVTHFVSLGSISASIAFPVMFGVEYLFLSRPYPAEIYMVTTILAIVIIVAHRSNIERLIKGTESKTLFFKK